MTPEREPLLRDQVRRLMGVLRQLAVARNSPIRHTSRYEGLLWLTQVQESCGLQVPEGPGAELFRIAREPLEPEPEPPALIRAWISAGPPSDAVPEPVLNDRVRSGDEDLAVRDASHLQTAFATWLTSTWRPWAERERARRPRMRIFDAVFDMHRLAADRPESIELVLSSALLHLPAPACEPELSIHLITQPISISQDAATGEMVATLAGDAVRLEDDELLSGLPMFDGSGSAVMRERLLELAETPVADGIATFLKEWHPRALTTMCTFHDTWERPPVPGPWLSIAPAVVARRRGAFALRTYYDTIATSLADPGAPVPLGLAQLVSPIEPAERLSWLDRTGATAAADLAADPLFPLPANEEQSAIIRRLGSDSGVVVEGPPGTGKTHTIANLVSALLARGQRVLVTSEKAQALRVLRDKLPTELQELCVSLTDATAKGDSDLARSVATVAGAYADFDPLRTDRSITDLTARRVDAGRRRAELLEDIRALREAETYQHPEIAPGYRGTLAAIARAVAVAEPVGWVPGFACGEPPVAAAELEELLPLLAEGTPDRAARRDQRFPTRLPLSPEEFATRVESVRSGDAVRAGQDGGLVAAMERLPPGSLVRLDPLCRELAEAAHQLRASRRLGTWPLVTADALLAGDLMHPWHGVLGLLPTIDEAAEHDRAADFADVTVADGVDPEAAAAVFERFAAHLSDGATLRRMFKSPAQKEAEAFGERVVVNGAVPATAVAAAAAGHHLRFLALARRFDRALRPLTMRLPDDRDRSRLLAAMHTVGQACLAVDRFLRSAVPLRHLMAELPPADRPGLQRVPDLERMASTALALGNARSAAIARTEIDTAVADLLAAAPPDARPPELVALVEAARAHDAAAFEAAVIELGQARRDRDAQLRCDELIGRLRAVCRPLADLIEAEPSDPAWAQRLPRWPQAWARACAVSWLAEQVVSGREKRLEGDLAVAVSDLRRLTGELAAAQAWKACLHRMTAEQVQALQSYRAAMARVGKGTGKYAERFRRSAREALTVAQSAVPAWVMPIQQVLASVPPEPGTFDVVIVDEASQADLTSVFLLWLAPRVIVVGDDKQCTPSEVASGELQPIFDRIDAELPDLPSYLRTVFTPKDSLFSLLRTRFGQVVRLREHFRCMPEIITWSSNEFYRDAPLVPLRQFGADRLPPLRHTYVRGAQTEGGTGRVANREEAHAIAESVRACLDDPAYEGRTFGVVVLQSTQTQVDLISHELRQRIDVTEWEARRIRVGTAPDFQGDERHVVWLSMVAAPNSPLRALTRETFRQNYNVAASRAQDQLWLFHSVTPDLLGQSDLRHSLLTYMLSEGSRTLDPTLTDVDPDRRHDSFDSLFEQRVFLDLVARGYHVTPQVESNRRRIDLVVTGAAGKLAVECDGEAFHTTPEQRSADLDREQELKRCGWTFVRIRESLYYLNREQALLPVWAELDRLGIGPLGGPPVAPVPAPSSPPPAAVDEPVDEPASPRAVVDEPVAPPPAPPAEVASDAAPSPGAVDDRQTAILRAADRVKLTADSVGALLAVPTTTAARLLDDMVAAGLLSKRRDYGRPRYVVPTGRTAGHTDASVGLAEPDEQGGRSTHPDDPAAEFDSEMRGLYGKILTATGYRAGRLLSLVSEHGGVATAHQVLAAGSVTAAFTALWEQGRLDLSVEAMVLRPRYRALFHEAELATARYRLTQHDFPHAH